MKKIILSALAAFFIGCGSSYKEDNNETTTNENSVIVSENIAPNISEDNLDSSNKKILLKYGYFANANVDIYQINSDGTLTHKFSEITKSDDDNLGYFDTHYNQLDSDKFYLFTLSEGKNCDLNFDGYKDSKCIVNNAVLHLVAKGSDIKAAKHINISIPSQIIYERVLKTIRYNFDDSTFNDILDDYSKTIFIANVAGSSSINNFDTILFRNGEDNNKLEYLYRLKLDEIIDLTNKRKSITKNLSPIVGEIKLNGNSKSIDLNSNYAYLANNDQGLMIVDVSDVKKPILIENLYTNGYALGLKYFDNRIYMVEGYNGIEIIDVADPSNPFLISNMDSNDSSYQEIVLSNDGKTAYIAAYDKGFDVVDVSDILNPSIITKFQEENDTTLGLFLDDDNNLLYVADYNNGLKIVDVSDKSKPKLKSKVSTDGNPYNVVVYDKFAYVANGSKGVAIVDVNDSENPKLVSTIETKTYVFNVVLSKDKTKLYAHSDKGIDVIDIKDPNNPKYIAATHNNVIAFDGKLGKKGVFLYVADDNESLKIIDTNFYRNH